LPQPDNFAPYAVDRQDGVSGSTLELYRQLLRLRRDYALGTGQLQWQSASSSNVLVFDNGTLRVVVNLGMRPIALPQGALLVSSEPLETPGELPGNTAAWLRLS
jgi:alpha-glucosidase